MVTAIVEGQWMVVEIRGDAMALLINSYASAGSEYRSLTWKMHLAKAVYMNAIQDQADISRLVSVVGLSHLSNTQCLSSSWVNTLQQKVTGSSPVRGISFSHFSFFFVVGSYIFGVV